MRISDWSSDACSSDLFELKYFFTAAIAGADGTAHSAEAVRHRIRVLIAAENGREVLSDDTIVDLLRRDGVDIASGHVATSREAIRIPSSAQRRRTEERRVGKEGARTGRYRWAQ